MRHDTGIRIEVNGNQVNLRGPRSIMRGAIPHIELLNYHEIDGEFCTEIHDPVPENRVRVNKILHRVQRLIERPDFMQEGWLA